MNDENIGTKIKCGIEYCVYRDDNGVCQKDYISIDEDGICESWE